jgi:hypothetical protein
LTNCVILDRTTVIQTKAINLQVAVVKAVRPMLAIARDSARQLQLQQVAFTPGPSKIE